MGAIVNVAAEDVRELSSRARAFLAHEVVAAEVVGQLSVVRVECAVSLGDAIVFGVAFLANKAEEVILREMYDSRTTMCSCVCVCVCVCVRARVCVCTTA